jgi:hypothetical protein
MNGVIDGSRPTPALGERRLWRIEIANSRINDASAADTRLNDQFLDNQ